MSNKMKITMKRSFSKIISAVLVSVVFVSCGLDNYDTPQSQLTGKVVFDGEPVPVRGSSEAVRLQIYQPGYQNYTPIDVIVTQDGSYSALLFDGDYRMVTRDNNGPWVNSRDTTYFSVHGNTVQDIEVTPYYMIRNASMSLAGKTVTANFTVEKTGGDREIDRIILLVGKTSFVDDERRTDRADWTGEDAHTGSHSLTMELSAATAGEDAGKIAPTSLFGRICVWAQGADQGVYSEVFKLK